MTFAATIVDISDLPKVGVRVTMTGLNASTETATLYRLVDGKDPQAVRDAIGISAVGGFTVPDYEVPLGVPFTYRAMQHDASSADLGYTPDSDPTTITPVLGDGAPDWCIVSDPLQPDVALVVQLTENAARRPSRPIRSNRYQIGTATGVRVVALTSPRGLIERLPMDFWTETAEDAATFETMVTDAQGLLLFRTFEPIPVPRLFYVMVADPIPDDVDLVTTELIEHLVTVDQVSPSTNGYGQPLFPWSIYEAAFPLWSDMEAAYLTWLGAYQNPPAAA